MEATILYSHVGIKGSWAFTVNSSGLIIRIMMSLWSFSAFEDVIGDLKPSFAIELALMSTSYMQCLR